MAGKRLHPIIGNILKNPEESRENLKNPNKNPENAVRILKGITQITKKLAESLEIPKNPEESRVNLKHPEKNPEGNRENLKNLESMNPEY